MERREFLLSVIVPVYNREKTLPDLLQNFSNVKNRNFEIILVNDGSTDQSERVCADFAAKDERCKVISKMNGGVSSARNAGIEAAKGKFLTFFDGDDLFVPEVFERAINGLANCLDDVLVFDFEYDDVTGKNSRKSRFVLPSDHVLNKNEIIKLIIEPLVLKQGTDFAGIWNKFFAAKFFGADGVRFRETMFRGEDWRFILDCLDACETVRYIPETLYVYRLDGTQTDNKYKRLPGLCMLDSYKCKDHLSKKYGIEVPEEETVRQSLGIMNAVAFSSSKCSKDELSKMICDPTTQSAARQLLSLDKEKRLKYEVTKRYRVFACFIKYKEIFFVGFFAKIVLR